MGIGRIWGASIVAVVAFALVIAGAPRPLECTFSACSRPPNPLEPFQPLAALAMVAAVAALAWWLDARRKVHYVALSGLVSLAIVAIVLADTGGSSCSGSSVTGMNCSEDRPVWAAQAGLTVTVACVAFLVGVAARRVGWLLHREHPARS